MSGSIKIVQPPKLPGDRKYEAPFRYDCSGGHYLEAESPKTACYVAGCEGTLKRVGTGARSG